MKLKKGFTLIELLVVIAIIGILSTVVLASLTTARSKSQDAAIEQQMSSMRAQAELYYSSNGNSYGTAATCGSGMFSSSGTGGLSTLIAGVSKSWSGTTVVCGSNGTAWAVGATLQGGGQFCVDSTGKSGTTTTAIANNATICT